MCLIFLIKYSNFKGKTNWHARQEAVKLRLREREEDIEFPHFIQLSCFTKCHRLPRHPRLDTNCVTRVFTTEHFWMGLSSQSKKSIRTLTRGGGNNHFSFYFHDFHLFEKIWNLVNLLKWQFSRISHDLTTGESGYWILGSCQNWIKEKWSEVFPSFETKIHIWRGTRDEHDRVVCLSIMCGYNVKSQGWEVKCFRKYFYCIFDISYYTNLHSLNCTPRIYD